ncbi:MAG: helix-turn-helix transcriptional regulator [SAR86 cluster bacterium]|uniref:Helix-turn-helix transcriptional regulator n=1 Tax=SAR86 cluster bacterium TaxID=2030880 RepID=A0A972VV41_9GAMM|nr:helix-turn-helix transcriptional regulator [SAR86 cluster bacterium]
MLKDLTLSTFGTLLGYLYDGHIQEDPYSKFLQLIREILDLNFSSMTLREPVGDDGGLLFISCDSLQKTFIDDHENPYTDRYYTSNLMTNLPWGQVVTLDECIPYDTLVTSELYTICMQPINIYHMAGMDLRNANGQRFTIRFCRPMEAENFSQPEKDFLAELAPHIQRAVANGMQLIQLDSERKMFSKTISGMSIGIITLDERGRVINSNFAADELLKDKDGIYIARDQLHLTSPTAKRKLNEYITLVIDAQRNQEQPPVNAMAAERPSGKADLEILIKPLLVNKSVESSQTPHLMVFVSDPGKKYEIDIRMLTSLYHLTRSEAMLAKHLAAGETLDQSASNLGIARNTARAQLRAIFAKTGVTQQSMLVSLILKSLATFS